MSSHLCFVRPLSNMCSIFNPSCVYLENSFWAAVCTRVPVGISEETDTGAARERNGTNLALIPFGIAPGDRCHMVGGWHQMGKKIYQVFTRWALNSKLLLFFHFQRGQSQSSSLNSYQTLTFVMSQSCYNAETLKCICIYTLSDCQAPTVLQKLYY